jgi:hypothetical protein
MTTSTLFLAIYDLHWLTIAARAECKIAQITFKTLTVQQPSYLSELIQLHRPTTTIYPENLKDCEAVIATEALELNSSAESSVMQLQPSTKQFFFF